MANTGSRSTVANHPARAEIEAALTAGEPLRSISAKYGVSKSSLSRFGLSHRPLERIVRDQPNVTTILPRLIEAADDARDLRRLTRVSGNAPARARAIKTEADILAVLADRLGIDDTSVGELYESTGELVRALRQYAVDDPTSASTLLTTLREYPALTELADALRAQIKATA